MSTRPFALVFGVLVLGVAAGAYWLLQYGTFSGAHSQAFVGRYCMDCHNADDRSGDLVLEDLDAGHPENATAAWEAVVRKTRVGMMPPIDAPQPTAQERREMLAWLEDRLDVAHRLQPDPGAALLRRMNRAEYQNAVRDLLHLNIDVSTLLPPDDSAYGFDNIADALTTSPLLVEQYLSAAGKIAALAVGDPDIGPSAQIFRFRQDASQNIPVIGMPLGTVGGGSVPVVLPLDGEYRIEVTYYRSNLGAMKGLELPHDVEVAVDDNRVHLATIGGREDFNALMQNITAAADAVEDRSSTTLMLTAGEHRISVGFVYAGATSGSTRLQPFLRSSQDLLDVTGHPHIETLTVTGPFNASGPGQTRSRERIFSCHPDDIAAGLVSESAQNECAAEILSQLARRAYRGMDSAADVDVLMTHFEAGRSQRGFEAGIQTAIERILISPKFTFRFEQNREADSSLAMHRVSDLELATRLSYFLWGSIPDDQLLDLALAGELSDDSVLEAQVLRMLSDAKADALVDNFAGQWLYLRNIDGFVPNSVGYPDFDDNLRQGLRTETELFFESIVAEDRSVLDLMTADYTFLNERVARHYRVPGVYGAHFRRVTLEDESRWGLLGKGSILMVASHTDRTSPVVRGKWVLENILGSPPPAPPAEVPALDDIDPEGVLSFRERLELHRENPACAACHASMDPIGFALENFDAVGAWRENEAGIDSPRIDAGSTLMDGSEVIGPVELRQALMRQPELFVSTVTEKLMIYALGRGLTASDQPEIRRIVSAAADDEYRFSAIVLGVVDSIAFKMRRTRATESPEL